MLEFAAVVLRGDALQYYEEHIRGKVKSYDSFKELLQTRFNNQSMQKIVKKYQQ